MTDAINPPTLARLREAHSGIDELLKNESFLLALSSISRSSPFLTRLVITDPQALNVLTSLDLRPTMQEGPTGLSHWKQLELLRIAARDLSKIDSVEVVSANLADLAQDVLNQALELSGASDTLSIIGMGKLGGRELNYSSDIDIMFVGAHTLPRSTHGAMKTDGKSIYAAENNESIARKVMATARLCFRVDAALRPEGRDGPLVRSVDSYVNYWQTWAQPWEFQALLKARPMAGNLEISNLWQQKATAALWDRNFGADELRELRQMKERSESIVIKRGLQDREVKRGKGGIRDIEFSVQLLQLVHGRRDDSIRSATTLKALNELATGGYIGIDDMFALDTAYRFLRNVEHRLQLVEGEQTHTIPSDASQRSQLARSMHFMESSETSALESFDIELRKQQTIVRHAHERLYFRPLLEAFARGSIEQGGALEDRLNAFGFTDANRTREAVVELTRGLARSSRLMQQLMPLLLDWLSESPNPDEGLFGLRTLVAGFRTPVHIVSIFRDSPEVARRLCRLLGTSRLFSQGFSRYPDLLVDLGDVKTLTPSTPVLDRIQSTLEWQRKPDERNETLRRFAREEQVRIAAADVLELTTSQETSRRRTELAEAVLKRALIEINPPVGVAIIGMGRFGGSELAYASDLDVIVVHNGESPQDQAVAEETAQRLLRLIGDTSPSRRLYPLDYDLRPEGKKGVLARSLDGCRDYYAKWAQTWERQALIRARPVAGNIGIGKEFMDIVQPFVWEQEITAENLREIRHLKARMETERLPKGGHKQFNLKLGSGSLSDVEWTTQLLQLRHRVHSSNTLIALQLLNENGHISDRHAEILGESWKFCDQLRNRLFIVEGVGNDTLPSTYPKLTFLARSLRLSPAELQERYLQVTRRARATMEQLFYGQQEQFDE